ncbi:general transcription factor 3C polypeptide 4-like isoform X1 [Apostichopus japonicus]|uniref:general transcription factor 3C polypeptide 4-like isoform X1 n=2 Tax=Stichopus japonicus TaxID=307972 RepID=UPI003AB78B25
MRLVEIYAQCITQNMAVTTILISDVSQTVLHDNCISCSEINQIAIVTKEEVKILEVTCDPHAVSQEFSRLTYSIPSSKALMDLDVGIEREDLFPGRQKHPEIGLMNLDNTLWPKDPASMKVNPQGFCRISWSQNGCDPHHRCLLAGLQSDHKLLIYCIVRRNCETKLLVDLSDVLWQIKKKEWKVTKFPTILEKFQEFKKRKYSMAFVTLAWSNIMCRGLATEGTGLEEDKAEAPVEPSDQKVLLATALRDGGVIIWVVNIPLNSELDVAIATTIETDFHWPRVISWCDSEQDFKSEGLLAVGSLTGEIGLWSVCLGETETTTSKVCSLWDEQDDIMIDNLCWMKHSDSHYFLLVAKGQHVLVFLLSIPTPKDVKVIHRCIEDSLHAFPSSGVATNGTFVMSCCSDGSLVKITPSYDNNELKVSMNLLEKHPAIGPNHRGCYISPSGIYVGVVTVYFHGRREEFEIRVCEGEKAAFESLRNFKVPLFLKSDSLEWLRSCHIKNPAIEIPSDLPYKALQNWVEEEGAEGALYRLQLKRYLLIFQVTKVSHVAKITRQLDVYQDRVKDMETKVLESEEVLMALHLSKILRNVKIEAVNEKTVLMSYFWLTTNQTSVSSRKLVRDAVEIALASSKDIVKSVNTSTLYELCVLCGEKIKFQSLLSDTCSNGHTWRRCSLSLLLCQRKTRHCGWCSAKSCAPDESSSPWLVDLLKERCIFCSSVFVT